MGRQIVHTDIPFEEAMSRVRKFKRETKFYSGVSWHHVGDDYKPISQAEAARLAEQPGVAVILSLPVGGRGAEIIVQDRMTGRG